MRKVNSMLVTAIVLGLLITELVFGALPEYEIIDLGTLGGTSSYPSGINNDGQVVGSSRTADGQGHGFLWDNVNGMIDMTELLDENLGCDYITSAIAINNNGQIVGRIPDEPMDLRKGILARYFLWDSETGFVELTAFVSPGLRFLGSTVRAINDSTQVVGVSPDSFQACLWDSVDGMIDLGTLGGIDSYAYNINADGKVVGASTTGILYENGRTEAHAFLWDSDNGMIDLGTLNSKDSSAWAINNFDKVIGASVIYVPDENLRAGTVNHAFVWTGTDGMIDIHDSSYLSSIALGINDADQVVGIVSSNMHIDHLRGLIMFGFGINFPSPYCFPFLWDKRYGMINLNDLLEEDSGWDYLKSAKGINNKGQIIGCGITNDGETHGFLMTPMSDSLYISLNIQNAIDEKYEALETIDAALEKEWTAYDMLEEMFESGDYGNLSKPDIVKAKQRIFSAMQQQEQSLDALEKSIENLEEVLTVLDVEPLADEIIEK